MDADVAQAFTNVTAAISDHDGKLGILKDASDGHTTQMMQLESRLAALEARGGSPWSGPPVVIPPQWNHPPGPWGPPRPWGPHPGWRAVEPQK